MADVRALLRQQRAARRIEHPHASYSDAGKLTCTVCYEPVKTEALWDGHLRSAGHRQRLQSLHQASTKNGTTEIAGFVDSDRDSQSTASHKRKLSGSDDGMFDGEEDRRKRTRADVGPAEQTDRDGARAAKNDEAAKSNKPITPPLTRRTSGTPTFGVELEIPSRPATPSGGGTPMSITPKAPPVGRSPLIPDEPVAPRQQEPATGPPAADTVPVPSTAAPAVPVDEDEWAAFEADLVHGGTAASTAKPPAAVAIDSDAVISAPVMTAAEVAAKSEEEERAKRRALADIQIEDEKEEATRALETEFEVMEELEARARKLRERREALRVQANGGPPSTATAAADPPKGAALGKENAATQEDEEDDDEDDMDDDWDGFRLRV